MPSEDLFYTAKFDENGEVREGWSYVEWLAFWWDSVPKTSTRNAHTVTRP
jgi:hypothetical protein